MAIRTRQEQLLDNLNTTGRVTLNNGFGQLGSILVKGTTDVTSSGVIAGAVFVSLTFIEDTVFSSLDAGLIPETAGLFPTSADTAKGTGIDADAGGNTDNVSFPAGLTIHGRWTGFKLASGKIIAYINY
jgi:hypothetical protein